MKRITADEATALAEKNRVVRATHAQIALDQIYDTIRKKSASQTFNLVYEARTVDSGGIGVENPHSVAEEIMIRLREDGYECIREGYFLYIRWNRPGPRPAVVVVVPKKQTRKK